MREQSKLMTVGWEVDAHLEVALLAQELQVGLAIVNRAWDDVLDMADRIVGSAFPAAPFR